MAAGPAVDALATQYAGRAVFIEQNVDAPIGNRMSRFWAVFTGSTAYLPLVIVDSGHQVLTGDQSNFETSFARLVDPELARPPAAAIEAFARQVGATMRVYATLRNASGTTLSGAGNHAALHALVYEDKKVGVTSHFMRAAPVFDITTPLADGATLDATIETPALSGVNWGALHTVVAADYVPGPGTAYDMLQATVAQPAELTVAPGALLLGVDSGRPSDRSAPVTLSGPYNLHWTATPDVPWLAVTPGQGGVATAPTMVALARSLAAGTQDGHVTLSATSDDGMAFTEFVTVTAVLGPRSVQARAPAVTPGAPLALPIVMTALGDEHAVAFTLAFDPAFLTAPTVVPGSALGAATLVVDAERAPSGRLGITVTLPAGRTLPAGETELAVVTFTSATSVPRPVAAVVFADEPVPRTIADGFGSSLTAAFAGATLVFPDASVARIPRRHLRGPRT